jgi:molybdopterin-binding protein
VSAKSIRARLGLSQKEFAELLGVHAMTVSKWERGVLAPNAHQKSVLRALADAAERSSEAKSDRTVIGVQTSGSGLSKSPRGKGRAKQHAPAKGRRPSRGAPARRDPVRFLSEMLGRAYAAPQIDLGTLSATNRFAGRIVEIARGDVMTKVVIEVSPEVRIGAVITTDSVDRLGLEVGTRAIAIIKATEVIVGRGG